MLIFSLLTKYCSLDALWLLDFAQKTCVWIFPMNQDFCIQSDQELQINIMIAIFYCNFNGPNISLTEPQNQLSLLVSLYGSSSKFCMLLFYSVKTLLQTDLNVARKLIFCLVQVRLVDLSHSAPHVKAVKSLMSLFSNV